MTLTLIPGQLTLAQLIAFFRNPCRALLRQRLGIELAREADELSDDESFVADRRIRRALWRRLLPRLLATGPAACAVEDDELRTLARADGVWPDGALGEAGLRHELHLLRGFAARLRTLASEPTLPNVTLTLTLRGRARADLGRQPLDDIISDIVVQRSITQRGDGRIDSGRLAGKVASRWRSG